MWWLDPRYWLDRWHRQWALANVRRTEEVPCATHTKRAEYMLCVHCAFEYGRHVGRLDAGAYHTHVEWLRSLHRSA